MAYATSTIRFSNVTKKSGIDCAKIGLNFQLKFSSCHLLVTYAQYQTKSVDSFSVAERIPYLRSVCRPAA